MGFLSGLSGILGGGSQTSSQGSSQSGFGLLPQSIQNAYSNYGTAINNQIPNATAAYTPAPLSSGENTALTNLTNGFTPTASSLSSDLSMLQNPFNSSVINQINQQANGQNSILKQTMDQNGTLGSNRQLLGANDIENTRQSNIGSLLQNQYNTALGQVFNNLIPQRQQDAENALAAGTYQRGIADQTNQAPIVGLQQLGSALGVLPTSGGSTQQNTSDSTTSTNGTLGNLVSSGGSLLESIAGLF